MSKKSRILTAIALSLCVAVLCWFVSPVRSARERSPSEVFNQVWQTIDESFFDPNFNGVDWPALREKYEPQVQQSQSGEETAAIINEMLSELKTSHTHLYTPEEPAYYQLLGIFSPRNPQLREELQSLFPEGQLNSRGISYSGIGIVTKDIDGKTFVRAIFDGSPAAEAGVLVGDRILSADNRPFHPIRSFAEKAGEEVELKIERSPDNFQNITVTPKMLDGTTMFLDAMEASIQIIPRNGKQIGYVHIWSYAGDRYQELLERELLFGRLKNTDGLILDLREGWGGASLNYLNLFTARGPSLTSILRDGSRHTYASSWEKPVVMLANGGSRSAKEVFAYAFQQYQIGPVVGSKTPGAVVAGRPFLMSDGSLLYVAVTDVYIDGETRLEGVGVAPDIAVPFDLQYARSSDPQKERAVEVALELVNF
ncbi:MAG: S41 family peptidase [Cyanobacteriota bacterium]|nr:S41 family peptidase [Cyanobacteriota bacterium]